MIRAIALPQDVLARKVRYQFILESTHGETLYYARRLGTVYSEGFYPANDVFTVDTESETRVADGWELIVVDLPRDVVVVDLPRDVAAALADAILTDTTGVAPSDARALRQDLMHERDRRTKLEP